MRAHGRLSLSQPALGQATHRSPGKRRHLGSTHRATRESVIYIITTITAHKSHMTMPADLRCGALSLSHPGSRSSRQATTQILRDPGQAEAQQDHRRCRHLARCQVKTQSSQLSQLSQIEPVEPGSRSQSSQSEPLEPVKRAHPERPYFGEFAGIWDNPRETTSCTRPRNHSWVRRYFAKKVRETTTTQIDRRTRTVRIPYGGGQRRENVIGTSEVLSTEHISCSPKPW